jgi:capsular polysaccharide biosynthesis protein
MNKDHQTQTETQEVENYEDEIELIDTLRVIWKWKYLILAGTVVCGLIAAIISLNITKIYTIDMVLRPGMLSFGEQGKNVYIDSPENIKALIESGMFDNDILDYLKNNNDNNIPEKLRFKVAIPKQSDTIKIQYETSDIKQGIEIQNRLSKLLLKSKAKSIKKTILSYKRTVKNIEKRINELTSESELIKNNTANLIKERKKLLSKNPKENNILSVLLYSNTIQQNLELSNNYHNEINDYKQKKEDELQKIDNIQNIQILQPATSSPNPIKPKIKLNVILALVAGLFLMLFLAFFLEYLSKFKKSK